MEADSGLCNFIFSQILITHAFEKQTKNRLSLTIQFKIDFLLPFTGSRNVLEKMPEMESKIFKVQLHSPVEKT